MLGAEYMRKVLQVHPVKGGILHLFPPLDFGVGGVPKQKLVASFPRHNLLYGGGNGEYLYECAWDGGGGRGEGHLYQSDLHLVAWCIACFAFCRKKNDFDVKLGR